MKRSNRRKRHVAKWLDRSGARMVAASLSTLFIFGCAPSGKEGSDLLVMEAAMLPLAPFALVYSSLQQGPTPSVDYSKAGVRIASTVYDNGKNAWDVAWIDEDRFLLWLDALNSYAIWSRSGPIKADLRWHMPPGFEDGKVWGVIGGEALIRPWSGHPPRDRLAAIDIMTRTVRTIPLAGCTGPGGLPLDGGLSSDGRSAYCLTATDEALTVMESTTGKIAGKLPLRAPLNSVPRMAPTDGLRVTAIGLTGTGGPLVGYRDGQVEWAVPDGQPNGHLALAGSIRSVAGVPGSDLLAVLYDGSKPEIDQRAVIVNSRTGERLFDQPTKGAVCCRIVTSRDGRFMALVGSHLLWLLSIDGSAVSMYATIGIGTRSQLGGAAFDPDGRTLAVISTGKVALFELGRADVANQGSTPVLDRPDMFEQAYGLSYAHDLCGRREDGEIYRRAIVEKFDRCSFSVGARTRFYDWIDGTQRKMKAEIDRYKSEHGGQQPDRLDGAKTSCEEQNHSPEILHGSEMLRRYAKGELGVDAIVADKCDIQPGAI